AIALFTTVANQHPVHETVHSQTVVLLDGSAIIGHYLALIKQGPNRGDQAALPVDRKNLTIASKFTHAIGKKALGKDRRTQVTNTSRINAIKFVDADLIYVKFQPTTYPFTDLGASLSRNGEVVFFRIVPELLAKGDVEILSW